MVLGLVLSMPVVSPALKAPLILLTVPTALLLPELAHTRKILVFVAVKSLNVKLLVTQLAVLLDASLVPAGVIISVIFSTTVVIISKQLAMHVRMHPLV